MEKLNRSKAALEDQQQGAGEREAWIDGVAKETSRKEGGIEALGGLKTWVEELGVQ